MKGGIAVPKKSPPRLIGITKPVIVPSSPFAAKITLGEFGSLESKQRYSQFSAEKWADLKDLPDLTAARSASFITVDELIARYMTKHVVNYFVTRNGQPSERQYHEVAGAGRRRAGVGVRGRGEAAEAGGAEVRPVVADPRPPVDRRQEPVQVSRLP